MPISEILSPKNKRTGEGRKAYENKRQQVLSSFTHLVEIDLLRGGEPLPILGNQIKSDYRILVSRSESRPKAELYPFGLQEQIPVFLLYTYTSGRYRTISRLTNITKRRI